jgi:uncharacterized protein YjdB
MREIRKILLILLIFAGCVKKINDGEIINPDLISNVTTTSSSPAYYISPTGSDNNSGTINDPWQTWQYGFNHISPGDILYIRGGTYTPTVITTASSRYCAVVVNGKNGTVNTPYQVFAYPGETPILDCRNITGTSYERIGILILNSSYWHLKGLTVIRVDQPASGNVGGQGIEVWGISSCTRVTIENCIAHHNGGPGMGTRQYVNEILFLNCDVYSNWDPYSSWPGGNADGFDVGYTYSDGIVRLTGCRAWLNGDDGFDMYQGSGGYSGIHYLVNCWAWHNGYSPTDGEGGDGCGFKLGTSSVSSSVVRRYLYNCISYDNATWGITQNGGTQKSDIYNCISYGNHGRGFDFQWNNIADLLRNNISYNNESSDIFQSNQTRDHNSWQNGLTVTNTDFVSVVSQLSSSRKLDGSLPIMSFLHLNAGSDLIGAGVSTGIYPTDGDGVLWNSSPSIGPFEYGSSLPSTPVTSISVNGANNSSVITTNGGMLQMSATVSPTTATNKNVTWSVINGTGSASISASGILTASKNGTVTVKATANDGSVIYGTKIITISNQTTVVPVISITIITVSGNGGISKITINGGKLQMIAVVLPTNATNKTVTWSVINGGGSATISTTGLLTAVKSGTVTVKATANDGSKVFGTKIITISNQRQHH